MLIALSYYEPINSFFSGGKMKKILVTLALLLTASAQAYLVPGDSHGLNPYQPNPGYDNGNPYDNGGGYGEQLRTVNVRCESTSYNRRAVCYAGENIRNVRIVRQLSNSACVIGSTVRVDRGNIVVQDGCRADFQVTVSDFGGGHGGGYQPPHNGPIVRTTIVTCESQLKMFNSCNVGGLVINAELVNQRSNSPCELGRSWGYDGGRVWVDRGCRASFRVTIR